MEGAISDGHSYSDSSLTESCGDTSRRQGQNENRQSRSVGHSITQCVMGLRSHAFDVIASGRRGDESDEKEGSSIMVSSRLRVSTRPPSAGLDERFTRTPYEFRTVLLRVPADET